MKGILRKVDIIWMVSWRDSLKSHNSLLLDPSINNDKYSDLALVQILNVPVVELEGKEVDFDIIEINENGYYVKYAKLIRLDKETNWDDIEEEYYREQYPAFGGPFTDTLKPFEWLKLYYNIPTRK